MPYDFYELFPNILRIKDRLSVGVREDIEGVLQRIVGVLEDRAEEVAEDMEGLVDLIDVDACPVQYLPFLSSLVGMPVQSDWSEQKRRIVTKAAVLVHMVSGMDRGWRTVLSAWHGADFHIRELYKSELHETHRYSVERDYDHTIKAARVDILDADGERVLFSADHNLRKWLELTRPVHVLIRDVAEEEQAQTDDVSPALSEANIDSSIVMLDEGAEVEDGNVYMPGEVCGSIGLEIESTCVSGCEVACEGECQIECETSCEGECEGTCQVWCELNCQESCEFTCQTSCEGTCEDACQVEVQ